MKIALLQMDIAWHGLQQNLARASGMLARASEAGAEASALPEMFTSGFSMDVSKAAEPPGGKAYRALSEAALKHQMHVIAGLAMKAAAGNAKNTAHVLGPDGTLTAMYSKCHPFALAGEDRHYEAGCAPVVFDLGGAPSSVFICYDLRFPEVFRKVADEALLIFVLANWPASRAHHWRSLIIARAIENQCFAAGVNRVGRDGNDVAYAGGSIIAGPLGEIVAEAGSSEEVLVAECNISEAERVRKEFPFLKDRRF